MFKVKLNTIHGIYLDTIMCAYLDFDDNNLVSGLRLEPYTGDHYIVAMDESTAKSYINQLFEVEKIDLSSYKAVWVDTDSNEEEEFIDDDEVKFAKGSGLEKLFKAALASDVLK